MIKFLGEKICTYLVRFIIEADNAQEAKDNTECILSDLLERQEFDWYSEANEKSGWSDCWEPVQLSSKRGQAWLQDAIVEQLEEFQQSMETVRYMVTNFSDMQIFNEEFGKNPPGLYLSRYQLSKASGYYGNACRLFDTNGDHITSQKLLDMYTANPTGSWVVQVDCHS